MKSITQIFITIVCIYILYLAFDYSKDTIAVKLGYFTEQTTTTTIDSTFTKGKVDTLDVISHYIATHGIVLNPEPEIIYRDRVVQGEKVKDSLKETKITVNDSLIEGVFTVQNDFKGNITFSEFKYKPTYPKYIYKTDTLRIREKNDIVQSTKKAMIGIGAEINSMSFISLKGSYLTKTNWQFIGGYGKNMIKLHESEPDNLTSFSVMYHF